MVNLYPHHPTAATNGGRQNRRIIHVPRRFVAHEWGGTETVVLELAKQQKLAGYDPTICTSMALAHVTRETMSGIAVERYPHGYPFFGLSQEEIHSLDKKGGNLLSMRLFKGLLNQPNVRLYHAHTLKRLGGMVRTAARIKERPYVVTLHGGVYDVPEEERQSLVQPILGKFEWGRPFGALFGSRRVLEDANMVICVGEGERAKAAMQLNHERLVTIPNGVDAERFATGNGAAFRARHGIPEKALVVLNIARIDPQKNQLLLVQAFREVLATRKDAHLVLIGPETHAAYAAEVRACIADLGLTAAVTLIAGIQPGASADGTGIVDAYHSGDIFVMPSRHEPFGIAVLEAWAAGLPVIASNVGGMSNLIRHGVNGLSFVIQDTQACLALAAAIEVLAKDAGQRVTLAEAGRQEARRRYSWAAVNALVESAYQRAEAHARICFGK